MFITVESVHVSTFCEGYIHNHKLYIQCRHKKAAQIYDSITLWVSIRILTFLLIGCLSLVPHYIDVSQQGCMRLFEKYKLDLMLLHQQNIRIAWINPATKSMAMYIIHTKFFMQLVNTKFFVANFNIIGWNYSTQVAIFQARSPATLPDNDIFYFPREIRLSTDQP